MCGFRSHQYQSCGNAPTRSSIHAVRRIPDRSVVVPSAAMASGSEKTATEDVVVREESELDVDTPVIVLSSGELVSVSEELSTDEVVREQSEHGLPVVTDFDALQVALGKDAVLSEPKILSTDNEREVVMLSPEVVLDDQVNSNSRWTGEGTHAGDREGKTHDEMAQDVKEVLVDGAIDEIEQDVK